MKVLVIGLDCAVPDILFRMEGLNAFETLRKRGCYGRLESIVPPITVPAWMCMATSQDPGSLGVYGFRNRADHSYGALSTVNARSIQATTVWDVVGRSGGQSVVIGVPPNYPPRRFPGVSVGCFLTPNTSTCDYTYPAKAKAEIEELIGEYPVDVAGFRTEDKLWLKQKIWEMTDKHFQVVRHFLKTVDWQYFQFLEIGLDRIHHGFWKYFDPQHRQYVAGHPLASVIPDYYRYLDKQIGSVLELVDSKTAVLIVSDHGAQRLEGGFCVNEWLQREGLLVLKHEISQPVRFSPDLVDWSRTRAWSEGGYYARVFFNIQGREPQGVVPAADYEAFAAEMEERFVNLLDDRGQPMGSIVFRPYRLYRRVERVAPDLIVHFGALYWRSIGGLGYENLYQQENDTGPDDCNHAQQGVLIMAVPGEAPRGQLEQLHLLDVAPTILELMGLPIPHTMQGRSILHREATV